MSDVESVSLCTGNVENVVENSLLINVFCQKAKQHTFWHIDFDAGRMKMELSEVSGSSSKHA
jgi:hypothetical protein